MTTKLIQFDIESGDLPNLTPEQAAYLDSIVIDYSDCPPIPEGFFDNTPLEYDKGTR